MTSLSEQPTEAMPSEEALESFKEACPRLYERIKYHVPWKLVFEAPEEQLDTAEVLLREAHHRVNSEAAPFITVDVAELLDELKIDPSEFSREIIYEDAVKKLTDEATSSWSKLGAFQDICEKYDEAGTPVLLFIKHFDAVTRHLPQGYPQKEIGHLLLTTFRVGGDYTRCMHVSDIASVTGAAGGKLNDAVIVIEAKNY